MDLSRFMPRSLVSFALVLVVSSFGIALASVSLYGIRPFAEANTPALTQDYGALPLWFVPNAGQSNPAVTFQANGMGSSLFFGGSEVVLALPSSKEPARGLETYSATTVRLRFDGSNPQPTIVGVAPQAGSVSYLLGNDSSRWRSGLPTYGSIEYQQLYNGIDLRYDGVEGRLKGTYTVAPGADPARIRWHYAGSSGLTLDATSGDLVVALPGTDATLTEKAPVAWQEISGVRVPVDVRYALFEDAASSLTAGFDVGTYDRSQPLTIDPFLLYSTLVGGGLGDEGRAIAVDSEGNTYVTGTTLSTDFPTVGPLQGTYGGPTSANSGDVFVLKLNPAGNQLIYATYLGGSQSEIGDAIALDGTGNVYIAGGTLSSNFPLQSPFQASLGAQLCSSPPCSDAFVAKLNAAGNGLVFSTYLGGSSNDISVGGLTNFGTLLNRAGIAVDSAGNVYLSGTTESNDFPLQSAAQATRGGLTDLFVAKFKPDGSGLLYSTFLGAGGAENSGGLAIDSAGNAYITGSTLANNFPTKNALQSSKGGGLSDAVLAKINTNASGDASLVYSTYLGGSGDESALGIAVGGAGTVALTGWTTSANFPVTGAFQATNGGGERDAFVAQLNVTGSALTYSTYLGGGNYDVGYGIARDTLGRMYVVGQTSSDNFPVREPWQAQRNDFNDIFVARIDPAAGPGDSLNYSTFFGSPDNDFVYGVAIDGTANAYITGSTGGVTAESLPVYKTIGPNATSDGILIAKFSQAIPSRVYLPAVRTP